jgi:lysophospholipase L1-like esterase
MDRRNFLRKTAVAGAATLFIPEIVNATIPGQTSMNESHSKGLSKGDIILFQGDSITDFGRNREEGNLPNKQSMLGSGYPLFIAANLLANHVAAELNIYNRGISGDKVFQLAERWDADCLDLKPNIVSILVGVNDYWHTKLTDINYKGTVETYETDYRKLLERTKNNLPGVEIVICEPFIIHGGLALNDTWEPNFAEYRNVSKALAKEFKAVFVPFQSVFNEALKKAPATYWGPDGVHPSLAGAQLMTQAWIKAVL